MSARKPNRWIEVTEHEFLDFCCERPTYHTQDGTSDVPESRWPLIVNWYERWEGNGHVGSFQVGRIEYGETFRGHALRKWFVSEEEYTKHKQEVATA